MDKVSQFKLTEEQYELVEKLSAANYSANDIAIYFNIDVYLFSVVLDDKESKLYKAYYRGALIVRAGIDINLANYAAGGKITAIQTQMKRKESLDFESHKKQIFDL